MDNTVTFQINIAGNVFAGVGKLHGEFNQLVQVVGNVDKSVNHTFNNLKNKIQSINLNAVIQQVQHVSNAIAGISAPGIGFEQGMADLSSITGTVGQDLIELAKVARQTGVESGLGAEQAARAFTILASQIQVDDIGLEGLKELQRNSITLSHAAGMSMDDAANALAGTINQFGLEAGEAARIINVLAAGSKYGAAEINDLAQSFKVVGAQASIAGLSVEDTAGALEVLSKNNLKGAEAGTNLRNIILSMQTTLGVDFKKNSLSEALEALKPKLNDATFMSQTFGRMSMAAAQYLVQNADAVADMTDKVTNTDTAMEQAAIRTNTVQQMMARCTAKVNDLKIGFFELTGSAGGYATIIGQQAVTVAQLLPLLTLLGKGIKTVTSLSKLQAMWTGIVSTAQTVWTGVQWALNASLWGCPLVWIVAAIGALVAIIVVCVTKVEGWGRQWNSVVNFMKLTGQLFVETIKFEFNTMINGIMLGLDYIKLGWYKFKEACGLGDSTANQEMIAQIGESIEQRKRDIVDGAKKVANLAVEANNALTWELSWKKKDDQPDAVSGANPFGSAPTVPVSPVLSTGGGLELDLSGKKGRGGSGSGSSSTTLDLNKIIPNLKGSTAYSAIASRLAPVAMAAASMAMPVSMPGTAEATTVPFANHAARDMDDYLAANDKKSVSMTKFCDTLQIHIANADGKGYDQVRKEVIKVLDEIFDTYGA